MSKPKMISPVGSAGDASQIVVATASGSVVPDQGRKVQATKAANGRSQVGPDGPSGFGHKHQALLAAVVGYIALNHPEILDNAMVHISKQMEEELKKKEN